MANDLYACPVCRRPSLPVAGWVGEVMGYRYLRSPWSPSSAFLDGGVHFACLLDAPERHDFAREFEALATGGYGTVEYEIAGRVESYSRTGYGFTAEVFRGSRCRILRNGVMDRWMVLEDEGPWHELNPSDLQAISSGNPVRSAGDEIRFGLPSDPGDSVREMDLPALIEYLGVADRYPGLLDSPNLEFTLYNYYAPKRLISYSLRNDVPLLPEATEFLREYAKSYSPLRYPDDEAG